MYLSKIHLVNFRLFSDSLFDLQETTLITGKNGAGKTSVLEAIHVILKSRSFRTSSMNRLRNLNEDNISSSSNNLSSEIQEITDRVIEELRRRQDRR